jgi:hypothetical protein
MSPIKYTYAGSRSTCRLGADGRLSIPQAVLDDLGWRVRERFELFYTKDPLIMHITPHPHEYILRSLNTGDNPSGGLLTFSGFANNIASPRVKLPKERLLPIPVPKREGLTLMLSEPLWVEKPFSAAGSQSVNSDVIGVYRIRNSRNHTLRIGQGNIRSRINEHLRNDAIVKKAKTFQHAKVDPERDIEFIERVLLARFVQKYGELPEFNPIQA